MADLNKRFMESDGPRALGDGVVDGALSDPDGLGGDVVFPSVYPMSNPAAASASA